MTKRIILAVTLLCTLLLSLSVSSQANSETANSESTNSPIRSFDNSQTSLMFIEQEPNQYQVQVTGQTMWITPDSLWLQVVQDNGVDARTAQNWPVDEQYPKYTTSKIQNTKLTFENANPNVTLEPFSRLETKISYFIGNDPDKWQPDVPVYAGVRYRELYPNTDLVITSENGRMVWRWEGVGEDNELREKRITEQDNSIIPEFVVLTVDDGTTTQTYRGAELQKYSGLEEVTESKSAGFLNPVLSTPRTPRQDGADDLVWSTFLGGSDEDYGNDIAVDTAGNVYLTGRTRSTDFPTTAGAFDPSDNLYQDAFVVKLNSNGTALSYATFLGGDDLESGQSITVDSNGNAYIMGQTDSADFPTTAGAYNTSYNSGSDIFVVKLNSSGTALGYATFIGGNGGEIGKDIALDSSGNVYLTGFTYSTDFPTTTGAYDTSYNSDNGLDYAGDVFVAKLNSSGTALNYATFIGGNDVDKGYAIAIDSIGNAYLTGQTRSADFPTTAGAYDTYFYSRTWKYDVFVAKLNNDGTQLYYSTFLGGDDNDSGSAIAIDDFGNAYLIGTTYSSDFPTTNGAYDTTLSGSSDVFMVTLNSNGTDLNYATFLGGDGNNDWGRDIVIDNSGNVYLTGETDSADFPTTVGAYDTTFNGNHDIFVASFGNNGTILNYATFFGGNEWEVVHAITTDNNGNVYLTGDTYSAVFPTTTGAYDTSYNGGALDAFISKLTLPSILHLTPTNLSFTTTLEQNPSPQAINITNSGPGVLNWTAQTVASASWLSLDNSSGIAPSTLNVSVDTTGLTAGFYTSQIQIDSNGGQQTIPVSLTIKAPPLLQVTPTQLEFTAIEGSDNPLPQTITISNGGDEPLSWTASETISWLTLSSTDSADGGLVDVSVDTNGLSTGIYSDSISIASNGGNQTVPISLSITSEPLLAVTPSQLTFNAVPGEANPASQALTIRNQGTGTLRWTATISQPSNITTWLTIDSLSGTTTAQDSGNLINLAVDSRNLAEGIYVAHILFSSNGGSQTVPVTLDISSNPSLQVTPLNINFETSVGTTTLEQSLTIYNKGTGQLNWTASDNAAWLSLSQNSGTVMASNTAGQTITIMADPTGLDSGIHTAEISLNSGTSQQTIVVTLTIADSPITTIQASNSSPSLVGKTTTFTATTNNEATNVTYSWNFGDGSTTATTQNSLAHTYQHAGQYLAEVTASNGTSTLSGTTTVTIEDGDQYEFDNSCPQAIPIPTDGTVQHHTFHIAGDADWVVFEGVTDATYAIEARVPPQSQADVKLDIFESCDTEAQAEQDKTFSEDVRYKLDLPTEGKYYLKLSNSNAKFGNQVEYHLSVRALETKPKPLTVLIVAGRNKLYDKLQRNIHNLTNRFYKLFRDQGYDANRIYYLAHDPTLDADGDGQTDVDGKPTKENLERAITEWAANNLQPGDALTMYLMDHGAVDKFYLDKPNRETLTPDDLDRWLTELETTVGPLNINIIIEACNSGSFITPALMVSKPGRVVVTAASADTLAHATENGAIFSDTFIDALQRGLSIQAAFQEAYWDTEVEFPGQSPWLDDNGDGTPNGPTDGQVSTGRGFSYAGTFSDEIWPPYIAQTISPTEIIKGQGLIQAEVRDDQTVAQVWAIIQPPSYTPPENQEELVEANFPVVPLVAQKDNWYELSYSGFREVGTYRVIIQAVDNEGLQARPQELLVQVTEATQSIYIPVIVKQ